MLLYNYGSHEGEQICEEDYVLITDYTGAPYLIMKASELLKDSEYVEFLKFEDFRFGKSSKEEYDNEFETFFKRGISKRHLRGV